MMSSRLFFLVAALPLCACNSTTTQTPAPVVTVQSASPNYVTPSTFRMPEGAGCTGDIARFEAVMANDLQTGHVNKTVYDKVMGDLNGARSACSSGNGGAASAQVRSVKSRYGYP